MAKALRGNRPPPRPLQAGEPVRINATIDQDLLAALDAAADRLGRSRMSEIAVRLRASLDFDAAFGGPRAAAFFRGLASEVAAYYGDDSWLRDPARFDRAREHIVTRLNATRIIPPPTEGPGGWVEMALIAFAETGDQRYLATARDVIEDPDYPADWRAPALARIAEVEANPETWRSRQPGGRVHDDGHPLELLPDPEGAPPPPKRGE